jgi:hypothetical protein
MPRHAKTTSTYSEVTTTVQCWRIINRVKANLARLGIRDFRPNLAQAASLLKALRALGHTGEHAGRTSAGHWPTSLRGAADQEDRDDPRQTLGSGIRRATQHYGAERAPQAARKLPGKNHRVDRWDSLITSRCVGRPIRNRSPRPAPIDRFLERPAKHENDEDENNADHHDLPPGNCASRTRACGNPDNGRRGEPLYVMAFLASDNHACTQKTDASHDALNHAAGVGGGYRMDRQNCQGRAETQDAEGAYASSESPE